ncbi:MAG TPA: hypothetical protein VKA80_13875 [Beijerinckiaceae bacterium]|nr:hypothetical protein [Beijerinckiaceae bacterium]
MNGFTEALQALQSDPASFTARNAVLNAATALTTRIGSIAGGIQSLRTDAENRIASPR